MVRHCLNPGCPSRSQFDGAAEHSGSATTCADCGLPLVEGPGPLAALAPAVAGELPARPGVWLKAGEREWVRRLGVSLAAMLAAAFCTSVNLPGVWVENVSALIERLDLGDGVWNQVHLFGAGLGPFLSAFVLVELVALLVPRWRWLRTGGPAGRARLRTATVVVGVGLAILEAQGRVWFIEFTQSRGHTLFIHGEQPTWAVLVLVLTGGVLLLHLLTVGVERYGLGNGYAVVILGLSLSEVYHLGAGLFELRRTSQLSLASLLGVLLGILVLVGVMVWFLRRGAGAGEGQGDPVSLRLPTSGLAPLTLAFLPWAFLSRLTQVSGPVGELGRFLESNWLAVMLIDIVLSTLLAVMFSVLFHQPRRVAALWADLTAKDEGARALVQARVVLRIRELLPTATGWSVLLLTLTWLPSWIAIEALGIRLPNAKALLLGVGIVLDLMDEVRMRREGTWVAVWPVHRVYEVEPALARLLAAGIPARARGTCARSLLQFFGPYFAIDLMVPPRWANEARSLLQVRGTGTFVPRLRSDS